MTKRTTRWLEHLETLRPRISGRDHQGKKGSLRWLEARVAERGGKAGSVRNILYKDLGSPEEKLRLFQVIVGLYREAGLEAPSAPAELGLEAARRTLGRDKRQILRKFVRELQAGSRPQMVVVGGPATGKGVLLSAVERLVPGCLMINLGGELAPQLYALSERLNLALENILAQLSPTQPYALQASLQAELKRNLQQALNQSGLPLLLRAEADGQIAGLALRNADGERAGLGVWLEPVLIGLEVPYLAALSDTPVSLSFSTLSPPTREEARRYVRERLPGISPERLEALVNQAGKNFGELSRLVLLEAAQKRGNADESLARDPKLRPLLEALSELSPDADPHIPVTLLEEALGKRLDTLSQAERALFEPSGDASVRPTIRSLLQKVKVADAKKIHALAFQYFKGKDLFRSLVHAKGALKFDELLALLARDPSRLSLVPDLWKESAAWPLAEREQLATVLVRYRAVLGQYAHPETLEALELLTQSKDEGTRAWARVKAAEARLDAGEYTVAKDLLPALSGLEGEVKAEGLLVEAAIARWQGDYALAEELVGQAQSLPAPPFLQDRVRLWQGLVAKDAGRYSEALEALGQVEHEPLLQSRAQYQAGDLLMRLGKGDKAVRSMEQALAGLVKGGAPSEEVARVRARLGTALRRVGQYLQAADHLYQAIAEAPDGFTRARAESEASILESARLHPWEALELAAGAEAFLREARGEHSEPGRYARREEARYRHRRTLFRLAVAYWVRDTGNPYRPPYLADKHSPRAYEVLQALWSELTAEKPAGNRYQELLLDTSLMLSLLEEPDRAQKRLASYLSLANPHLRGQAILGYAQALTRLGKWGEALAQLVQVEETEDLGAKAWRLGLEAQALTGLGQPEAAWSRLLTGAALPVPFRVQLGRTTGPLWELSFLEKKIGEVDPLAPGDALALWLCLLEVK